MRPTRGAVLAMCGLGICVAAPCLAGTVSAREGARTVAASPAGLVFVADYVANTVDVCRQGRSGRPIATIAKGLDAPIGVAVHGRWLYVANNKGNTIVEYAVGSSTPTATLTGLQDPIGVAVGRDGTVYACPASPHSCAVYAHGSTTPTATLRVRNPFSAALDAQDNLYVACDTVAHHKGRVMKFARGQTTGVDLGIRLTGAAGDIQVDRSGNILLGNQRAATIDIYPPGTTSPSRTIGLGGRYPYQFTLDATQTTLYLADLFDGSVVIFDYGSGRQIGSISQGLTTASGVGVSPAPR